MTSKSGKLYRSIKGESTKFGNYVRRYPDLLAAYKKSAGITIDDWGKLHYETLGKTESRILPWSIVTAGTILNISPFLPKEKFDHPIDMTFDKSGNLFILEYGSAFNGMNGKISKVTYVKSELPQLGQ